MSYILALDQGTTSSRALIFDHEGKIRAVAQREHRQHFPQAGWVEHDPREIWSSQIAVAIEALGKENLRPRDIAAIGITNQRETTVIWNRESGEPIHNAIVWQDRRTAGVCDQIRRDGYEEDIQQRTGLLVDAYFSATKIAWLLDHVAGARTLAEAGKLAFGTIDSWLAWNLTSGAQHITDVTNASRTMLYNIHTGEWDEELLRLFRVPREVMPVVRSSSEVYGPVRTSLGLEDIPIAGIAGDQHAALFGQACYTAGQVKCTYGTGCFLLQNTGDVARPSHARLLTTLAWKTGSGTSYALEGSIFMGGAVVQWLRDGLGLIRTSPEVEPLAASVADNGGVYLVPAFAGLGAPHWDSYARGTIVGLTRGSGAGHVARAALESIAYQVGDVLEAMHSDSNCAIPELRVDGGASQNNLLMQFQADILQMPVLRPSVTETTALGVAYLAGLAVGYWSGEKEIARQWGVERRFEPRMTLSESERLRGRWLLALERAKRWEPEQ
ncbi:MAG: glycerol kinase GlpK [Acidobacteriota bacterium]|nr:glycerol kinase GlpK [Acidobacteriota bacterium]